MGRFSGILMGLVFLALCGVSSAAFAQPRFAIEPSIGQSFGVTSYIDDTVIVQDNQPFIASENADSGIAIALTLVFDALEAGVELRWFDRQRVTVGYEGTTNLPSGRIRPDGTVDDAAIVYEEVEPITLTLPSSNRGSLFTASLFAGYRLSIFESKSVGVFVPFAGGLVLTHIQEDQREYEFGLTANTGLGVTVDITSPVAIFTTARIHGLVTPTYGEQTDASRAAVNTGDSTIPALLDTFAYASLMIGLQFTVR